MTSMAMNDEFSTYWARMAPWIRSSWDTLKSEVEANPHFTLPFQKDSFLSLEFGGEEEIGVEEGIDSGLEYVDIGFMLPDECYAVIDEDTYGTLCAIRIFRED